MYEYEYDYFFYCVQYEYSFWVNVKSLTRKCFALTFLSLSEWLMILSLAIPNSYTNISFFIFVKNKNFKIFNTVPY